MTAVTFTPSLQAYQFYEDGTESGSTTVGTQDTALSRNVNTGPNLLLRIRIQNLTATGGNSTDDYQLQRSIGGGAFADVTTSSTGAKSFDSTNLTDQGATTNRLTGGTGTFAAGKIGEAGLASDVLIGASQKCEFLYTLTLIPADLPDTTSLTFRAVRNGVTVPGTVTPTITVVNAGSNKTLAAAAGSFALTGTAATLRRNLPLVAGAGSYALSGTAASLLHKWSLSAGLGSYALTGTAANLLHAWRLTAGAGSYLLTGTTVTLTQSSNKLLAAGAGAYAITGTAATLLAVRKIAADAGAFLWSGSNANLVYVPVVAPTVGGGDTADPLYYRHWRKLAEDQKPKPPEVAAAPAMVLPAETVTYDEDEDMQGLLLIMHEMTNQ